MLRFFTGATCSLIPTSVLISFCCDKYHELKAISGRGVYKTHGLGGRRVSHGREQVAVTAAGTGSRELTVFCHNEKQSKLEVERSPLPLTHFLQQGRSP